METPCLLVSRFLPFSNTPLRLCVGTSQGETLYVLLGWSKAARTHPLVPGELWTKQNIWLIDRAASVATDHISFIGSRDIL